MVIKHLQQLSSPELSAHTEPELTVQETITQELLGAASLHVSSDSPDQRAIQSLFWA